MGVTFQMISPAESWRIFDDAVFRNFGVSGQEFEEMWESGFFAEIERNHGEIEVVQDAIATWMMRPSVSREKAKYLWAIREEPWYSRNNFTLFLEEFKGLAWPKGCEVTVDYTT